MSEKAPPGLRSSSTGRVPQWVLDEADGRAPAPVPFRAAASSPSARRASRRWGWRGATTCLAVVCLLGLSLYLDELRQTAEVGAVASGSATRQGPPPGREEGKTSTAPRLAQTRPEGASFRFSSHAVDRSAPVTWSPCRPIHYVVRPDNAPPSGPAMLARAVAAVSAATGLRFVEDGSTDESPSEDRQAYQPERYGDRWAPVLITWATPDEVPDFGVDIAGEAGPVSVTTPSGDRAYVSGVVHLDAAKLGTISSQAGFAAGTTVVAHELGHLVGLAHVNDPQQVMYPRGSGQPQYGSGDLTGLALLGHGPCQPDV